MQLTVLIYEWYGRLNWEITNLVANSSLGKFSEWETTFLNSNIYFFPYTLCLFQFYGGNTEPQSIWWRQKHWKSFNSFLWCSPHSNFTSSELLEVVIRYLCPQSACWSSSCSQPRISSSSSGQPVGKQAGCYRFVTTSFFSNPPIFCN